MYRNIKFKAHDTNDGSIYDVKEIVLIPPTGYLPSIRIGSDLGEWGIIPLAEVNLMQYIGIDDKNNIEIYEDYICQKDDAIYQIVLMNDKTRYGAKIIKSKSVLCRGLVFPLWQYIDDNNNCSLEIIGNIYKNPELLEVTI